MTDCIFCKIVKGEISSSIFWEDCSHIAFFDLFPNTEGQALVIPKNHHNSYAFGMDDESYVKLSLATKEVGNILKNYFDIERVGLIMEGMGVDHVHMKLYPMHGLGKDWEAIESEEKVFFGKYPGFLTTKMGTMADSEKLIEISKLIKNNYK